MSNAKEEEDDNSSDDASSFVHVLDTNCYLIRQALDMNEQIAFFEDIQNKHQRHHHQTSGRAALYPSPRTVQLGENKSKIKFAATDATIFRDLVDKANTQILNTTTTDVNLRQYKSITLSVIEYKAAEHTLAEHIDHDDSFVYLLSMGCTTNFLLNGPSMSNQTIIQLKSGDLLVFDASTKGKIRHGIQGIIHQCPPKLAKHFPVLQNHRYGIQFRVRF